ncbi:hypothetical protein SOV_46900 [Sporomusa ovata DSM 2662]|uniref:Uncharacterized protein n=1 Tax=Sporomusa ovata TaxID=2378 RepID=A0A0U1KV08_9FIRM|nr:hypothetical protein SOV_3c09520 [Sporomusa ovata DSM 2662]CQR71176.1 hypothetical protein SpAn4DRAFT_2154 [Sporomusa ovata]
MTRLHSSQDINLAQAVTGKNQTLRPDDGLLNRHYQQSYSIHA